MAYDNFDYEDFEDPDDIEEFDTDDKEAPPLPELKIDISQEALRHELSKRLREVMDTGTLRKMAEQQVRAILDEEMNAWLRRSIGKTVTGLVEEYFTKSRNVTNHWGEEAGGAEALGDAVVKRAESFLKSSTSSHSRSSSRLQEMVQEILLDPIEGHVKKLLAEIRSDKEDQVTKMIAKMLGESMKKIGS